MIVRYISTRSSETTVRLTNSPVREVWPSISDDGKAILFCTGLLYRLELESIEYTLLFERESTTISHGRWVPKSKDISFIASGPDVNEAGESVLAGVDVYRVDADGSNLRRITNSPETKESAYDWSPNGEKIAFLEEDRTTGRRTGRIKVQRSDDHENQRLLAEFPSIVNGLAWSSSGESVYCAYSDENGRKKVALLDTESGEREVLPIERFPYRWDISTPQGALVAVYESLFRQRKDWSHLFSQVLVLEPNSEYPHWSNNGEYVIYSRQEYPRDFVEDIKRGKYPEHYGMVIVKNDGTVEISKDSFNNQTPLVTEWPDGERPAGGPRYKNLTKSEAETLFKERSLAELVEVDVLSWYEE